VVLVKKKFAINTCGKSLSDSRAWYSPQNETKLSAFHPAHGNLTKVVVVLRLVPVFAKRRRSDFETRAGKKTNYKWNPSPSAWGGQSRDPCPSPGGTLARTSLYGQIPNRNSFTSAGENNVRFRGVKEARAHRRSKGKLRDVELMLLASVLPSDSCKSPAQTAENFRNRKREARGNLIGAAANSRSQFRGKLIVGEFSGWLTANAPVAGSPLGIRKPLECSAELIALELKQFYGDGIQAGDARGKTGGKKLAIKDASERFWAFGQSRKWLC